ncbi:MAG: dethiobiotin synthase, partial [Betaproteobacteria bacterium]
LVARGARAAGMKPIAAGVAPPEACNADVAALANADGLALAMRDRNPYSFAAPIAPHLAARDIDVDIDLEVIAAAWQRLGATVDCIVVEGAGGVLVPLNDTLDMLDLASRLQVPVLLVVGMRLGCINHALLSVEVIRARGLTLAGWVANEVVPAMPHFEANVETIGARIGISAVAVLRHGADVGSASVAMDKVAADLLSGWRDHQLL